jgi:hypothetical protein
LHRLEARRTLAAAIGNPGMTTPTATHGSMGLSTPWAREGITPEQRAEVESHLPEGYVLGVSVTADKQRWELWLVKDGQVITPQLKVTRALPHRTVYPLRAACLWALEHWTATGVLG